MTAFVIDLQAERNARIEEANRDDARRRLHAVCGLAINHMLGNLPGAAEAWAIIDKAEADLRPEDTEDAILARMETRS
jgi:hypothetical protein